MQILRDFVVAIADHDYDHIDSLLAEQFSWALIGQHTMCDRDELRAWITALRAVDTVEFGTLVTHGRGASVDGALHFSDGSRTAFSHVLRFSGATKTAKVAGVKSYIMPLSE